MKRKYWIQRISHLSDISTPLLEKNYLSIGYVDFALVDNYLKNLKIKKRNYLDATMKKEWGFLSRNRYQLWRYLMEMKKGHWVLVPSYGHFSIYELVDDEAICISDLPEDLEIKDWSGNIKERSTHGFILRDQDKIYDLGFSRKVKLIKAGISRSDYADNALTSRLKVRQANVDISDLEESILKAKDLCEKNTPLNFRREMKGAQEAIRNAINKTLDANKFEKLVKWYFERIGATSVAIPPKNSSEKEGIEDIDVDATFELLKTIYYVQVKHHHADSSTGIWGVEQIKEMFSRHLNESMEDGYSKIYWLISSASSFSEDAVHEAKKYNIQLINGVQFADMLLDAGLHSIENAF